MTQQEQFRRWLLKRERRLKDRVVTDGGLVPLRIDRMLWSAQTQRRLLTERIGQISRDLARKVA